MSKNPHKINIFKEEENKSRILFCLSQYYGRNNRSEIFKINEFLNNYLTQTGDEKL